MEKSYKMQQMAWDYPAFTEGNQADRVRAFLLSGTGKGTIRKLDKEMVQWNKPKGMCDEDKMILQGWLVTTRVRLVIKFPREGYKKR